MTGTPEIQSTHEPLGHTEAPYSCIGSFDMDTRATEQQGPLGQTEASYSLVGSFDRETRDTEQPGPLGHTEATYY